MMVCIHKELKEMVKLAEAKSSVTSCLLKMKKSTKKNMMKRLRDAMAELASVAVPKISRMRWTYHSQPMMFQREISQTWRESRESWESLVLPRKASAMS